MGDWDWNSITVTSGEWWLFLIGIVLIIVSVIVGWFLGYRKGLEEHNWPENKL